MHDTAAASFYYWLDEPALREIWMKSETTRNTLLNSSVWIDARKHQIRTEVDKLPHNSLERDALDMVLQISDTIRPRAPAGFPQQSTG
jgi:hypothetical protein